MISIFILLLLLLFSIASNFKGVFNKFSGSSCLDCGDFTIYQQLDSDLWSILVSTWTTGADCDTTASTSDIQSKAAACIDYAKSQSMIGYCCRMDHGGDWHADLRVCVAGTDGCGWDMPCILRSMV